MFWGLSSIISVTSSLQLLSLFARGLQTHVWGKPKARGVHSPGATLKQCRMSAVYVCVYIYTILADKKESQNFFFQFHRDSKRSMYAIYTGGCTFFESRRRYNSLYNAIGFPTTKRMQKLRAITILPLLLNDPSVYRVVFDLLGFSVLF